MTYVPIPGFDEFELDIELAFKRDLPPFLDRVVPASLTEGNVRKLPSGKNGVYLLLERDIVRYVGKTDARAGFQDRLLRHASHVQHRKHLDPREIFFKAVAIPVFKNADIEDMLITHYNANWNQSGFGSNDPGRNRDEQEPAGFDREHPIDVDIPLDFVKTGTLTCRELLQQLADNLPYTFRFEKRESRKDLEVKLSITRAGMTMREVLRLVVGSLPKGKWQATIFHGRVTLYPAHREYAHKQGVIR